VRFVVISDTHKRESLLDLPVRNLQSKALDRAARVMRGLVGVVGR
jgi:hypothetical protein